ncbi:MAG: MmcQ/YjbR family DNA-binding protein [Salaquimonas sp.]|jgi:hypothetical protein|nr:MmcQ/YjbR family DNA-binding protein [Salaquimonas sp.]
MTADEFIEMARSLEGTTKAPHVDRIAFRVNRNYATLAADRASVNLKLTPEEQEFRCMMNPGAFSAVPKGWGRMGWTTVDLAAIDPEEMHSALTDAWRHAVPAKPRR